MGFYDGKERNINTNLSWCSWEGYECHRTREWGTWGGDWWGRTRPGRISRNISTGREGEGLSRGRHPRLALCFCISHLFFHQSFSWYQASFSIETGHVIYNSSIAVQPYLPTSNIQTIKLLKVPLITAQYNIMIETRTMKLEVGVVNSLVELKMKDSFNGKIQNIFEANHATRIQNSEW